LFFFRVVYGVVLRAHDLTTFPERRQLWLV
jgi:hypothetical protein